MQVNAVHILVVVTVAVVMAMVMTMIMAVRMPMVMSMIVSVVMVVTECHHSNQVNKKTQSAHNKELAQSLCLSSLPQPFKSLKGNFDTE
jgi:uncharacterized membrane protein YhaH (DUF805 family)